jgi:glycosyltransferase involved in cell wall biosynthesis
MTAPDLSVVIPARNEPFLTPTIRDVLRNARSEIEVYAVLEDWWPDEIVDDERVHYIHNGTPRGMRGAINQGMALAKGEHVMKCDAHCAFSEGFDVTMMEDLEDDWIAVPRRYSLNPEEWRPRRKSPIDYLYLCYPNNPNDRGGPTLHGRVWGAKNNDPALRDVMVDDLMSAQGSCYFMHRAYNEWLELLDEKEYGAFSNEFQEVGLKCWLSGGRVVRNKNAWYCHLHKGRKYGRGWPLGKSTVNKAARKTNQWMPGRNWHRQDRDIRWLLHKFWPLPGWPEESVRLVFNRRRGGSGDVRGEQVARHFKSRLNLNEPAEDWHYDFDVHVWVKQEPRHLEWPGTHYLDVMDETRRVGWLLKHPECGVIAESLSGQRWLKERLGRDDVLYIPIHHCNFERKVRERDGFSVAGVCGGAGAIQCDAGELEALLARRGLEWRWYRDYHGPADITEFYRGIDVQIVWRERTPNRPLKDPEKIVNAMSLGVPTVAFPEVAYEEVEGYYWPARDFAELAAALEELRGGWDAQRLIDKAEEYHIENTAKGYGALL